MNGDTKASRQAYFEQLYRLDEDPWRYHSCDYEIEKRADTLTFLRNRYRRGCEIGCSIGLLTAELAPRCGQLLAIDISPVAAAIARQNLTPFTHVEVQQLHLPHEDLPGKFDLLVLSEVLYFLDVQELGMLAEMAHKKIEPDGELIIVSYDGETRTNLSGRAATDHFLSHLDSEFNVIASEQREHYHIRLIHRPLIR